MTRSMMAMIDYGGCNGHNGLWWAMMAMMATLAMLAMTMTFCNGYEGNNGL